MLALGFERRPFELNAMTITTILRCSPYPIFCYNATPHYLYILLLVYKSFNISLKVYVS